MQSILHFDTLAYMEELKRSGMKNEEAEALTKATQKALGQIMDTKEIATKSDILIIKLDIEKLKVEMEKTKIELLKYTQSSMWKTISILATFQSVLMGVFGLINHLLG